MEPRLDTIKPNEQRVEGEQGIGECNPSGMLLLDSGTAYLDAGKDQTGCSRYCCNHSCEFGSHREVEIRHEEHGHIFSTM